MTRGEVAAPTRRLLAGVLALLAALTGCRDGAAPGTEPTPMTAEQVQALLAKDGPAGKGQFPGGTFTFGSPFDNSDSPFDDSAATGGSGLGTSGRVASTSWDIYWHRDDGDVGAWGTGIDVLTTPERAARALDEEGGFWCPAARRGVGHLDVGGVDDVRASTCRRAGGEGFYATLDGVDGPVLTSLTVAGPTRRAAVAALSAVWPTVRDAVVRVRASLV